MANVQDLVANFHTLEGNFITEKRKNLSALLNLVEASLKSEDELSAFIAALKPRNRLEEIFKVVALIKFRKDQELLEVLKSGKPSLIKKLLNCWPFLRDTFGNADARTIVNEVFPYTSYSTRVKVINRLSKNLISEQRADDYFKAIEDRYGLKTASVLLPGCSLKLVKSVLIQYKIKLKQGHLLPIIKKHPSFLEFYCQHLETIGKDVYFCQKILKYVAKTNPELFWQLLNKYTLRGRFGKHMTRRMLENKGDIDVRFNKYFNLFRTSQMLKILAKDNATLRKFCLRQLPSDVNNFYFDVFTRTPLEECFSRVKDNKRYDVLNFYFREKYKQDLHDFPQKIPNEFLKMMPDDKRELVLDEKVKVEEDLVYMYKTRKSIPILKERINCTSDIATRDKLVINLLKTCSFNKDDGALLYVLRYMWKRHKNDLIILQSFVQYLANWVNLGNISAEHWDLINDFVKILEISIKDFRVEPNLLELHLAFLVKNNLPHDEQLKSLLLWRQQDFSYQWDFFDYYFFLKNSLIEKFWALVPELFQNDDVLTTMSISFLQAVILHNEIEGNEEIPITNYPEILALAKSLATSNPDAVTVISYCIQKYDDEYDSFFWENLNVFNSDTLIKWCFKTKPLQVIQNLEEILKWCSPHMHMQLIKKLAYTRKTTRFYLDALLDKNCTYREVAISTLSLLLTHEEYFEAVKDLYPPSDGKIDVASSSHAELSLQKQVVENLKHLIEPTHSLPILLKYCKADYLKYALDSLYHLVTNTPEINLPPFFGTLYNAAVSVRKHVVFLTSIVSPKEVIYDFLKTTGQADKNSSLQKAVLRKTLMYFIENPSEAFWKLFQENIKGIDKNDREAHKFLLDLTMIPEENLPQYIEIVYEKLAGNSDNEIIQNMKFDLMIFIPDNVIKKLDEAFLRHLIDITLLVPDVNYSLVHFYLTCIFHSEGQKQANLYEHVVNIWKNHVKESWSDVVKGEARKQVYDFVYQFCVHFINFKPDKSLLEKFANDWKNLLDPEDAIEEYLIVDFTVLYFNCDSEREFGRKLNKYLHEMVQKYDTGIVQIFAEVMEHYLSQCLSLRFHEEEYFAFVESFFYEYQSPQVYLALLETLCKKALSDKYNGEKYKPMYELVRRCNVPIVQVRLKRYLRREGLDQIPF